MRIVVSYDPRAMNRFLRASGDLSSPRLRLGLSRALNKVGDKARTQVRRALRTQMGVKRYATIKRATHGIPSNPGRLEYRIIGTGKGLKIEEFPVRRVKRGVSARPWRVARVFKRSFANGGKFRARLGDKRFPIRALYGPSVAKEIVKDDSAAAFTSAARALVPALSAAVRRLLP